jgi:hypothetical protein
MKPPMTARRRRFLEGIDQFCGRCNHGLTAVAIVLVIIVSLLGAFRAAQAVPVPERFDVVGTT